MGSGLGRSGGSSAPPTAFTPFPIAPNLLDQDFAAAGPNRSGAPTLPTCGPARGWLYLAVVIDLFARRVVGWATGDRLHKELALSALRRAIAVRRPVAGRIGHADRGSQYCSLDYQAELKKHGILISMSGRETASITPWSRRSSRR